MCETVHAAGLNDRTRLQPSLPACPMIYWRYRPPNLGPWRRLLCFVHLELRIGILRVHQRGKTAPRGVNLVPCAARVKKPGAPPLVAVCKNPLEIGRRKSAKSGHFSHALRTIARSMADAGPIEGRYMPHAPPIVGRYGKRPHSRMQRLRQFLHLAMCVPFEAARTAWALPQRAGDRNDPGCLGSYQLCTPVIVASEFTESSCRSRCVRG